MKIMKNGGFFMGIVKKDQVQLFRWEYDVTLKNVDDFQLAVNSLLDCESSKLILELAALYT
jgi:hypothetical protein